jgi:autotransporter-associated beta strand protein
MRKFYSVAIAVLAMMLLGMPLKAQRYGMDPATAYVNQSFNDVTTLPFTTAAGAFTGSGAITLTNQKMQFAGSGTGNRGLLANVSTVSLSNLVTLDFEWNVGTAINEVGKYSVLSIRDNTNAIILAFMVENWGNTPEGNKLHCFNLKPTDLIAYAGNVDCITRGADVAANSTLHAGTLFADKTFALAKDYNVKAEIDLTTKKIKKLTIRRLDTGESVEVLDLDFIQAAAAGVHRFDFVTYRNGGANSAWTTTIDNLKIYPPVEVANVTVKYEDLEGTTLKSSRVAADQVVGSTYQALVSDKADISYDGKTYVYDESSTSDVVVATGDASTIVLKFKAPTALYRYTWTGLVNSNWDFSTQNFNAFETISQTDAGPSVYVNENEAVFTSAATNKNVSITQDINLKTYDLNVAGGYSFSGAGKLQGAGFFKLALSEGETVTLGIVNELVGGTEVAGGKLVLQNNTSVGNLKINNSDIQVVDALTTPINLIGTANFVSDAVLNGLVSGDGKISVASGKVLSLGGLNTFKGGVQIDGATLNLLVTAGTGTGVVTLADGSIVNLTQSIQNTVNIPNGNVNFNLPITQWVGLTGALTGSGNAIVNFNQIRALVSTNNAAFNGTITLKGETTSALALAQNSNFFSETITLNILLGEFYGTMTPGAGSSYYPIGALMGAADAKLGNPSNTVGTDRPQIYRIGKLNTNTEFAGVIQDKRYGTDAVSGSGVGLEKVGSGVLTLSGVNTYSNPTVISEGSLNVTGALGITPLTVSSNGTLKGNGTIAGPATVNGTLVYEGMLFSGNLTLVGKTQMTVSTLSNDYMKVSGALVCGGDLDVSFNPSLTLSSGDKIQLFNPSNLPTGTFVNVTVNSALSFDLSNLYTGGYIEVVVPTSINKPAARMAFDKKYFSLTGVEVESNTVGTIIEKTIYSDGTIEIKKIVNNRR